MTTKERIMDEALTLFSQKGYGDVYVGEIADAVGIKAPSLYKHFKSKKDIFDAIIEEIGKRYEEQASSIGINGNNSMEDAFLYLDISEEVLIKIGKDLFLYFLHDGYMSRFRKMLTLEQFRNPDLAMLYTKQFFTDPVEYQTNIFSILCNMEKFKEADPKIMALQFYSPIYTLLTVCDRDPKMEKKAVKLIEYHIRQFNSNYGKAKK
ncbi:MAG: TetR/AcrR family transcriptional regulator [Clostridiales bacterium]|nr:TetR/AcrR family transcriptional regulator [Clostridiales bacterium]